MAEFILSFKNKIKLCPMGSGSDLPSDICLLVIAIRLSGLNVQKLVLYVKIFIHFTSIDLGLLQWPYVVSIIAVNLRRGLD